MVASTENNDNDDSGPNNASDVIVTRQAVYRLRNHRPLIFHVEVPDDLGNIRNAYLPIDTDRVVATTEDNDIDDRLTNSIIQLDRNESWSPVNIRRVEFSGEMQRVQVGRFHTEFLFDPADDRLTNSIIQLDRNESWSPVNIRRVEFSGEMTVHLPHPTMVNMDSIGSGARVGGVQFHSIQNYVETMWDFIDNVD